MDVFVKAKIVCYSVFTGLKRIKTDKINTKDNCLKVSKWICNADVS